MIWAARPPTAGAWRSSGRNLGPEFSGPRGKRRQPLDLEIGGRAEPVDPFRRQRREVDVMASPVRAPAVVVGEAVISRQLPRAEEQAGAAADVRIGGQRGDRASDEQRRLRYQKVRILRPRVAP